MHYTFNNVSGKTVTDDSGSGYDATIVSSASVMKMGKYNVLDLGNGTGYLDMGASIGNVVKDLEDYTVSAYYRVDNNASLSGNGYFLWSFSMVTANSSTSSQYMAYRLNAQRFAISTGGYSNESGIEAGGNATKNRWQHVVYRQTGTTGELFVDGQLVVSSTSLTK